MTLAQLENKYFFIAGATGGVGSLLARTLKAAGARVFLAARDDAKLKTLCQELNSEGAVINGASFKSYEDAIEVAVRAGKLDGAVCCTGSIMLKPAHGTTQDEFDAMMAANVTSAFGLTRAAAKAMMGNGGGSIVLVSSAAARIGLQNHEAIATAKAAVGGLCISSAASYARYNIRVNCIAPGLTDTPLTARLFASEPSRKASESMHPLGRLGRPEDIVESMCWLLSESSSWVTGQIISVDGGLSSLKTRS